MPEMAFNMFKGLAGKMKIVVPTISPSSQSVPPTSVMRRVAYMWQTYLLDQPISFVEVCQRARYYALNCSWLKQFLRIKVSVFHYGFHINAANEKDHEALDAWLDKEADPVVDSVETQDYREVIEMESNETNRERLEKFARDCWIEWFIIDNILAVWLDDRKQPIITPCEKAMYSDVMGLQTLRYTHGLSGLQCEQLPPEQRERWKSHPQPYLNPEFGEHWKLLKRSKVGDGFTIPDMLGCFKCMGQLESMEIGMWELGWTLRTVMRHHKLGHELKQNIFNKWTEFHRWTKEKSDKVYEAWKDTQGVADWTSNWDHLVEYPWPDLKRFEAKPFEGSTLRLVQWGGPLASVWNATNLVPHLAPLVRAEAKYERGLVGPFIADVINKAFEPPVKIKLEWSDGIFLVDQLRNELMKFAYQQGAVSQTTLDAQIGLSREDEANLKLAEASDKDAAKKGHPLYDASHATSPALDGAAKPKDPNAGGAKGQDPGSTNGKPPGGKDKS